MTGLIVRSINPDFGETADFADFADFVRDLEQLGRDFWRLDFDEISEMVENLEEGRDFIYVAADHGQPVYVVDRDSLDIDVTTRGDMRERLGVPEWEDWNSETIIGRIDNAGLIDFNSKESAETWIRANS